MTPIKSIILHGATVLVRDHADNIELKAVATNERDAEWLAQSLSAYHQAELERWDTSRGMAAVTR